jgi:hypothetical protein
MTMPLKREQGRTRPTTIKQGDSVTNSKCPDWGTGLVLSIGANSVEVRFQDVGSKRLRMDVLLPSSERAPIIIRKGKKVDPGYQAKLKELVAAFSSTGSREGIEEIEPKIYDAFLVSGVGKAAIKRQLGRWIVTNPLGRHEKAHGDAKALYDFLFPEEPRAGSTTAN